MIHLGVLNYARNQGPKDSMRGDLDGNNYSFKAVRIGNQIRG